MADISRNASLVYGVIAAGGAIGAPALAARTGLSQPSVSRALTEVNAEIGLLIIRSGRSISYAIGRHVKSLPMDIPIHQIHGDGSSSLAGTLTAISGGGYLFRAIEGSQLFDGLPWFLHDMRAQGYLGRAFCHAKNEELGLSPRLLDWSDDDALYAMAQYGSDLPGNLLVGAMALRQSRELAVRTGDYDAIALESMSAATPGSSAGGEHPKFVLGDRIVKFSPTYGSELSTRWRDLLIAEHIAAETMRNAGIAAPVTRIIESEQRCYLESERFDRTSTGRRCVASLMAIDGEFIGQHRSWVSSAESLHADGMIGDACLQSIRTAHIFGRLIGNTDMHLGNLAFFWSGAPTRPDLSLAPIYDMLPMLYAPENGEIIERAFCCPDITSEPEDVKAMALSMANEFWGAMQTANVSDKFKGVAARHLAAIPFPPEPPVMAI